MIHATLIIEDTVIVATSVHGDSENRLHVIVTDNLTGKQENGRWTYEQFNAVVALSLGMGEDSPSYVNVDKLYKLVEDAKLFEGWQPEVIPVP